MNPCDLGLQDRLVVQEAIKEIVQSQPIYGSIQRVFKVVVLNEVDKLTRDAQHALRRTMEKHMNTCRLVLCCNSMSKVIDPVRSRCLALRVPAPSVEDIILVLNSIAKRERESILLPPELASRIAIMSEGNLRRAILSAEAVKVHHNILTASTPLDLPDWEEFIVLLAKEIAEEQSPRRLLAVRAKLYELLSHCIPPEVIFKVCI
jgi:replication factor C subunit 3/5